MKKKSIMIDMDEVMCEGGFLFLINRFLGTTYQKEYFKDFYMQEIIPSELRDEFFNSFLPSYNIYDYCYILPGAIEVIEKLCGYYDVLVGTDYLIPEIKEKCGNNAANKHNFLTKYFPFIDQYNYVFSGNKRIIATDIRIDDKLKNLTDTVYDAQIKLLFSAYHNMDLRDEELEKYGTERVDIWNEVEKRLLLK